jgi:arsenite methyltransferase
LELTESVIVPILNVGPGRDTFSAAMSGLVAAYVAGRGRVSQTDATAWKQDLAGLGDDYFFSLNRYLFIAHRS